MPMIEGEGSKEPVQKEASDGLFFSWTENEDDNEGEEEGGVGASHEEHQTQDMANEVKRSENEGDSGEKKESETEDKIDRQVDDSGNEEKNSDEEADTECEGEDQEKASESEGEDGESDEENKNTSGESEDSMTIGNTVIAPSKEESGEKRTEEIGPLLAPFTGDEEVSSDEDNLPLSAVGKKTRKTILKATKSVIPVRKEVALLARTPLTRSKTKTVDEQIIKESRGSKMPRKQVSVVEPVVELDGEDEFDSTLLEKSSA
ncbi:spore wall protein 2-like [Nicotiana tomentosiformis]|uniref:spore wall protein 2-like n=1 Tax=Nicotiana tomentosiformis TaxID=4098 RepID=UPI00051C21B1|nr:spore wall protein 2-like [Nicotiana tomentosiformis]